MILHEGIRREDDRRLAASLMNNVLGGSGFSSRMMSRVRSDEGLTYGVHSGFALRRSPGPFQVSTFTRVAETRRTIDLLLEELEAMVDERPVTEAELAHAKSYTVGRFGLSLETSAAVISSLVDLDVYGLPEDSLDTFRARIGATTRDQVEGSARELLHPGRAAIVVLGPAESLVPDLEGLGSVEVVQP
jgi:zinc protease